MGKGIVALLDNDNMTLLFKAIGFDASQENHGTIKNALIRAINRYQVIYLSSCFAETCADIISSTTSPYPIITLIDTSRDDTTSIAYLDSQAKKILGENFSLKELDS